MGHDVRPVARLHQLLGTPDGEFAKLSARLRWERVDAGTELVREGSPGREAYLLVDGEVEVSLDGKVIAVRGPGELVGEMTLLSYGPRCATARARTSLQVLVFGASEFAELMHNPVVARRIASSIVERLRELQGSPTWQPSRSSGSEAGAPPSRLQK